ncbi:ABC transporter permease [Nocardiopsis sp. YSL2]|uniref:ABC transporter permease n=1 Tax=Nocardiopsis sp. YSL2 TaxID=2939492 RepID=UPI0026F44A49|nr:ABC transporter permease [Nocardiopsis sp. YSL2]
MTIENVTRPRHEAAQDAGGGRGSIVRRVLVERLRELALVPALLALLVVGSFTSPNFLSQANLISIVAASSALAMMVLAESLILITGKFDLSIESNVGLAPAIGAMLVLPAASAGFGTELTAALGLGTTVALGAILGLVNGLLVVKLRLNAFIVTLAMLIVLRGLHVGLSEGRTLFDMPDAFFAITTTTFLGVPASVWVALVAYAIAGLLLKYHRLGRSLYAIGGNPEAARAAGIRVERTIICVYAVGGTLASIGGLMLTGYVGAISANQGADMIFTVFAAAVIGGISLDGGRGTMFGALSGVLLLGVVTNLLTLAQVSSFWIQAVQGAIILFALMIARLTTGRAQD